MHRGEKAHRKRRAIIDHCSQVGEGKRQIVAEQTDIQQGMLPLQLKPDKADQQRQSSYQQTDRQHAVQ